MIESLDVFFSDFATDVVIPGPTTIKAILDVPDIQLGGGLILSTEYQLTVKSSDIATLEQGDTLTIGADDYTVREIRKIDSGAISLVSLSKD